MNNEGWICPKCGRVYSPTTPMCFYCNNQSTMLEPIKNTKAGLKIKWTKEDSLSQEVTDGR